MCGAFLSISFSLIRFPINLLFPRFNRLLDIKHIHIYHLCVCVTLEPENPEASVGSGKP